MRFFILGHLAGTFVHCDLQLIHIYIYSLRAVPPMQGADQNIKSSLGFNIMPKDTSTCRHSESNQRPSESSSTPEPQPPGLLVAHLWEHTPQVCLKAESVFKLAAVENFWKFQVLSVHLMCWVCGPVHDWHEVVFTTMKLQVGELKKHEALLRPPRR